MLFWSAIAAAILLGVTIWFSVQIARMRWRNDLILRMLDDADQVEQRLLSCREKMKSIGGSLGRLPSDITADARATLDSEAGIQQALRVVLQHRLWIREHANTASIGKLKEVSDSIRNSLRQLDVQIARLDGVSAELAAAYARSDQLLGAPPPEPSAPSDDPLDQVR